MGKELRRSSFKIPSDDISRYIARDWRDNPARQIPRAVQTDKARN